MSKFPFQMQHDSMQCGIACLQMICKFYNLKLQKECILLGMSVC